MAPSEIRQLRERLGWSQTQLGASLHVSQIAVSQWERGLSQPDAYRLATLSQLKNRLDAIKTDEQLQAFLRELVVAALTLGVIGLLAYLFSSSQGANSGGTP